MADERDMDAPVTRRELKQELALFEERFERFESKLDAKLELWGGALLARIEDVERRMTQRMAAMRKQLSAELASHVKAFGEQMQSWLTGFEDKYRDLPPRVDRLEATVFAPRRRRR